MEYTFKFKMAKNQYERCTVDPEDVDRPRSPEETKEREKHYIASLVSSGIAAAMKDPNFDIKDKYVFEIEKDVQENIFERLTRYTVRMRIFQ